MGASLVATAAEGCCSDSFFFVDIEKSETDWGRFGDRMRRLERRKKGRFCIRMWHLE